MHRVNMVLRTELYGQNKVVLSNGQALAVLTYSFSIIYGGITDLQQCYWELGLSLSFTAFTILHQTWTNCTLLAMNAVGAATYRDGV